jgi:putative DNA primase/helicase
VTTADKTKFASEFTDSKLADRVVDEALRGRYRWVKGLDWLRWDGYRWCDSSDVEVIEAVRHWANAEFAAVAEQVRTGQVDASLIGKYLPLLQRTKIEGLVKLARGIAGVKTDAAELDADPDLLNTPSGVVDLRTGELRRHDPNLLMTRITKGAYREAYTHPDWTAALQALDEPERVWLQARFGQGITGRTTPDGVLPILKGTGENGKSLLTTDGPMVALGDYGDVASPKLIASASRNTEHSTEMADLRGKRFLIAEEMTEGRALNVTVIKRIMDVGRIKARLVHRDNISFTASHSLFATTNYTPVVAETDHGTWRRLAMVEFPYTFRKEHEPIERPEHRRGDAGLKRRVKEGADGQHDAIVTWLVEGAVRVHKEGASALAPTERITASTGGWRRTADRILGFWHERLVAEPGACVLAEELLTEFNAWLSTGAHHPWAKENFTPAFAEHNATKGHGVVQKQALTSPAAEVVNTAARGEFVASAGGRKYLIFRGPSRWGVTGGPTASEPPKRARVWLGVRYRTDRDDTAVDLGKP